MNRADLFEIVERYCSKSIPESGKSKIVRLPDQKTLFVEQHEKSGRVIYLSEHQVDGKTYWAGYSSYSDTVYISHVV